MKTAEYQKLSKAESGKIADALEGTLRDKILQALGSRKIDEQELKALTLYWTAFITNVWSLGVPPKDLASMSEEEIQEYALAEKGPWRRGLKDYSRRAGTSLKRLIGRKLRLYPSIDVLDIGCGNSVYLPRLKDAYGESVRCHAVSNFNPSNTEGLDFRLTLAEVLPEEWGDKFDLVTCFESSAYFWDPPRAFDEALRVTRPTGNLFYGYGGLRGVHLNEDLLAERLGLDGFTYSMDGFNYCDPETSRSAPVVLSFHGFKGLRVSRFMAFDEYAMKLLEDGRFERHGKIYEIRRKFVPGSDWSFQTLQVGCLGYA